MARGTILRGRPPRGSSSEEAGRDVEPCPHQRLPAPPIVFGTDGWRARIGEDYTYDNVRRCAQGVAEWVVAEGSAAKGVVVGYDRRFASEHFAAAAAEVLLAHDIPVALRRRRPSPPR